MARLVQGLRCMARQQKSYVTRMIAPQTAFQIRSMHCATTGSLAPATFVSSIENLRCRQSNVLSKRSYSEKQPLTLKTIEERVLVVLNLYDKVDGAKLTVDAHFINDLGLDSLDHIEVIMAMEDEFGLEIPDADAERLFKPADVIQYIAVRENIDGKSPRFESHFCQQPKRP